MQRRGDEAQPTLEENLRHLRSVEEFAPGRTHNIAQPTFHRLMNSLERRASRLVKHFGENLLRGVVTLVDGFDDVEAAIRPVQTEHLVNVQEENGVLVAHSLTRFPALTAIQAARRAWASAKAW